MNIGINVVQHSTIMDKRKQDLMTGKMSLVTLITSIEISPTVDRKLPLYFVRISQQKLLREILHIFE